MHSFIKVFVSSFILWVWLREVETLCAIATIIFRISPTTASACPMDTLLLLRLTSWSLGLFLGLMAIAFIFRIVLSWYPQADLGRLPFRPIAWLTEPLLVPVRRLVPPIGGVDIAPIIWVGIITLLRELLLGQQGLVTLALYAA